MYYSKCMGIFWVHTIPGQNPPGEVLKWMHTSTRQYGGR